mmetsp:Transcript_81468/g.186432  ORF Transcript_81468/g.186432 Transcript_81468/m.186432 type:complete len:218 (-) Transcript_81468:9-662(-)
MQIRQDVCGLVVAGSAVNNGCIHAARLRPGDRVKPPRGGPAGVSEWCPHQIGGLEHECFVGNWAGFHGVSFKLRQKSGSGTVASFVPSLHPAKSQELRHIPFSRGMQAQPVTDARCDCGSGRLQGSPLHMFDLQQMDVIVCLLLVAASEQVQPSTDGERSGSESRAWRLSVLLQITDTQNQVAHQSLLLLLGSRVIHGDALVVERSSQWPDETIPHT